MCAVMFLAATEQSIDYIPQIIPLAHLLRGERQ